MFFFLNDLLQYVQLLVLSKLFILQSPLACLKISYTFSHQYVPICQQSSERNQIKQGTHPFRKVEEIEYAGSFSRQNWHHGGGRYSDSWTCAAHMSGPSHLLG